MTNTQPLAELMALDLSQGIAGPYCARLLADQGARVLKVAANRGAQLAVGGAAATGDWLLFLAMAAAVAAVAIPGEGRPEFGRVS